MDRAGPWSGDETPRVGHSPPVVSGEQPTPAEVDGESAGPERGLRCPTDEVTDNQHHAGDRL